eukprot:8184479-Pyramimonas_sp.AAC.1
MSGGGIQRFENDWSWSPSVLATSRISGSNASRWARPRTMECGVPFPAKHTRTITDVPPFLKALRRGIPIYGHTDQNTMLTLGQFQFLVPQVATC